MTAVFVAAVALVRQVSWTAAAIAAAAGTVLAIAHHVRLSRKAPRRG